MLIDMLTKLAERALSHLLSWDVGGLWRHHNPLFLGAASS